MAVPRFGSYWYLHTRDPFTALRYSSVERRAVPLVYSSCRKGCVSQESAVRNYKTVLLETIREHFNTLQWNQAPLLRTQGCFLLQDYWGKQAETLFFQVFSTQQVSTEVLQLQAVDRVTDAWIQEQRQTSHRGTAWRRVQYSSYAAQPADTFPPAPAIRNLNADSSQQSQAVSRYRSTHLTPPGHSPGHADSSVGQRLQAGILLALGQAGAACTGRALSELAEA